MVYLFTYLYINCKYKKETYKRIIMNSAAKYNLILKERMI